MSGSQMKRQVNCGRYISAQQDISDCLDFLHQHQSYSFVLTPAFHPGFVRNADLHLPRRPPARSCRVLSHSDWSTYILAEISDHIDVDSPLVDYRKRSERILLQELNYAMHVNYHSVVVKLHSTQCLNLARIISGWVEKYTHMSVYMQVPVQNPMIEINQMRSNVGIEEEPESTWEWWKKFRSVAGHNSRISVMLEVGPDLPPEWDRNRWHGELVRCLLINTSTFLTNLKGFPVLSKAHQEFTKPFGDFNCSIVISGHNQHADVMSYAHYMKHAWNAGLTAEDIEFSPFHDYLQCPLQPLKDNLEAQTYEIFEKDPIKYRVYREAVESALLDRVPDEKKDEVVSVVIVFGAGRGPLVQMSLQAARNVDRKIRCYAVEKNPNAVITLQCRRDEEWKGGVTVVAGDMRNINLPEKADIMVSELLGSFSDNELSPECLDGAQKFLKDDGISIPQDYTSYVAPIMSSKLYAAARAQPTERGHPESDLLETMYVVMMKNKQFLSNPQPLFNFAHPNKEEVIDNTRYKALTFPIATNSTLHGFAGFFHTTLYKTHTLSIVPETFSKGMISWYPMYIPLQKPVALMGGTEVVCHFWRCVGDNNVWYEWTISSPEALPVHNLDGRAFKVGLQ